MEKTMKGIAAAAGAAAGLLTRMPTALRLLVLLMTLDYLSGVGVALLGAEAYRAERRLHG